MKEWDVVELLRYSRHDWLNRLQLIKGYLALNRFEQVEKIINQIIFECENETKLSNLQLVKFSAFILTYNYEKNPVNLKYKVVGNGISRPELDETIFNWFQQFTDILNLEANTDAENELYINMEFLDQGLKFHVCFDGLLNSIDPLEDFFHCPVAIDLQNVLLSKEMIRIELYIE